MPSVSVVIPAYNRSHVVPLAIESVLNQTWRDLEVIVIDDGSTDGTCDALQRRFDNQIRLERLPHNTGRSSARNTGWALARGEFIAFLDSDDLWLPEKLSMQIPLFERQNVSLVHCWVNRIDSHGRTIESETAVLHREFARAAQRGYGYGGITETWCRMHTSAIVLRRDELRRAGGFDPRRWNFEDWDLMWRVARNGEVGTVEKPLVLYRAHAGNTSADWATAAVHWLAINRGHLAEIDDYRPTAELRKARGNLLVNMALGEFWRRNLPASRRWMWRAILARPALLRKPLYYVWAAPMLHACLPHFAADFVNRNIGGDPYLDQQTRSGGDEVTLVIDDGPTDSTPELLSLLEHNGQRAVLFINGFRVEGREAILVDAVQRGFALGNHSYEHPRFSEISIEEARQSIERTDRIIERIYARAGVPRPGNWFRFPFLDTGGEHMSELQNLLRELNYDKPDSIATHMTAEERTRRDWPTTLCTRDWEFPSDSVIRTRLGQARPGDVVEIHDCVETASRYSALVVEELSNLSLRATVPLPAANQQGERHLAAKGVSV